MLDFLNENLPTIWGFLGSALVGAFGGAAITLRITSKSTTVDKTTVNQSGASAKGDIVGRDKTSIN